MTYVKTQWVDNQAPDINATNLNNMEQGIEDAQYPDNGTTGQVLTKTDTGISWDDLPETVLWGNVLGQLSEQTDLYSELSGKINSPVGGSAGQYLQKTASGTQWETIPTRETKNVTILSTDWSTDSCTITDSYITATSTVIVTYPVSTSDADYTIIKNAGIRGTAQASGSITLKATGTVPASDIVLTLIIWE